jgi:hypothetical protein
MPISESTRRKIFRTLTEEDISWNGNLNDVDFLSRIYDLDQLPSHDDRFDNAKEDIWQHTINNSGDWDSYWIFEDDRFDLLHCSEDKFLRFLCEMIHPKVRPGIKEAQGLLKMFNEQLSSEGYRIVQILTEFGNVRYEPTGILTKTIGALAQVKDIAEKLNSEHLQKEIVRMDNAIEKDPELAIGTAKEFVETVCKTILNERRKTFKADEDLPKLVYMTIEEVKPICASESGKKTDELIRKMLGNMFSLTQYIAELRNLHGTGHGKDMHVVTIEPRHASLAVNAATTLVLFLYQSYEKKTTSEELRKNS